MTEKLVREAGYVRRPAATVADLRQALEDAALVDIAQRNPGIDMDEVRKHRIDQGDSWTTLAEPEEVNEKYPDDPLEAMIAVDIDTYTLERMGYVMDLPQRDGLAKAIANSVNAAHKIATAMAGGPGGTG